MDKLETLQTIAQAVNEYANYEGLTLEEALERLDLGNEIPQFFQDCEDAN